MRVGSHGFEQNAETWWSATCEAIQKVLQRLTPRDQQRIVALSVVHQRETIVTTDARGQPLAPALLWRDDRAQEDVALAERKIGKIRLHSLTGKPGCTTPSLYKLMYLLRQRPELKDIAQVHDVHSFLSLQLTGRGVSSFPSADPSGMLDMRKKCWASSLIDLVGVEAHQLPELVEVGYLIGPLTESAVLLTGLPAHVLVYAGAGDAQAAGLGAGVTSPGQAFMELGTAVTCGVLSANYEVDDAFRTLYSAVPGYYCLETTLRGGMNTLRWLAESVLARKDRKECLRELCEQAEQVPAGSDGLLTIPYWAGVMNPYWDDRARGTWLGLDTRHKPPHFYRSILEGIAFEQRAYLEGIEAHLGTLKGEIVLLGGGSRNDLWCQILASVLGKTVIRSESADASALGGAMIAAVNHGLFPSYEAASFDMARRGDTFVPDQSSELYEQLFLNVYRGFYEEVRQRMLNLSALIN